MPDGARVAEGVPDAPGVARLILGCLFGPAPVDPPSRTFPLARFQEEAAARVREILRRRGGAVVADSVGLGKTFVALALIEEALREGRLVTVVVPAALRPAWRRRLLRVAGAVAGDGARRLHLLSHARLSRGGFAAERLRGTGLLVVDEAHAFRTPGTRRYGALAALCPDARVLLLTATPVNNRLDDLRQLLALFAADDAFRDIGVISLAEAFGTADTAQVRRVVGDVVVRRTRAMLEHRYGAATVAGDPVRFPRRAPPRVIRYDDPRVVRLVGLIEALELPMVSATPGTGALVRMGLLKRLESAPAALGRSVRRQLAATRAFADALSRGFLLTPRDRGLVSGGDDPEQLLLEAMVLVRPPPEADVRALAAAAARDLVGLRRMAARLGRRDGADPKLDALRRTLASIPAGERVVVFTEFRDTADALWRALLRRHRVGRVDGGGAWLGERPAGRRAVLERFAPRAMGRPEPPDRERVDILVATDVLAEGLDLQDARHVISYDLPWNPVRLLQRIGRVDRLGSPHESVVPYLFLPGAGLEDVLRLTRALAGKLDRITESVATEHAMDLLHALAAGPAAARAALDAADPAAGDPAGGAMDPMEALRSLWIRTAAGGSGVEGANRAEGASGAEGTNGAPRSVPPPTAEGAILLFRCRGRARLVEVVDGSAGEAGPVAVAVLRTALGECGSAGQGRAVETVGESEIGMEVGVTAGGESRSVGRAVRAARRYLAAEAAASSAPPVVGRRAPGGAAASRLRQALRTAGPAPPASLLRRADEALGRLARPLTAGEGRAAETLLEALPPAPDPEAIIRAIETTLPPPTTAHGAPPDGARVHSPPLLIAVLEFTLRDPPIPVDPTPNDG